MSDYYQPKIKKYGNSPRAVGWINSKNQQARFEAACDLADFRNSSILDAGCGLGHFYGFLRDRCSDFSYTGVDLSPEMVGKARSLFPTDCFVNEDILTYTPDGKFDYAVSIGPYNVEVRDNDAVMEGIIEKLYSVTEKGVAVSMTWQQGLPNVIHAFDADDIVHFCHTLTDNVYLRKNEEMGDIMIYLYRQESHKPQFKETAGYTPAVSY